MTTITYYPEMRQEKPEDIDGEVDIILGKYYVETTETIKTGRGVRLAYKSKQTNTYEMTERAFRLWSKNRRIAKMKLLD